METTNNDAQRADHRSAQQAAGKQCAMIRPIPRNIGSPLAAWRRISVGYDAATNCVQYALIGYGTATIPSGTRHDLRCELMRLAARHAPLLRDVPVMYYAKDDAGTFAGASNGTAWETGDFATAYHFAADLLAAGYELQTSELPDWDDIAAAVIEGVIDGGQPPAEESCCCEDCARPDCVYHDCADAPCDRCKVHDPGAPTVATKPAGQ